jgi:hypothetical protein
MVIKDLKQAEKIVENNKSLSWKGWDIVYLTEDENGFFNKDGKFVDNKWHIHKTYSYKNGWNLPDNLVRNVQI